MKAKWYFGTLLLLFISFGAFQEQISIPNQEIVLEFVDAKIGQNDIKNTIADVKEKLLKVGVSNIKIQETKNGTLKISYYSAVHVDNIKDVFSKENKLVLNNNSEKNKEKDVAFDYNIDVYELTNQTDISNLDDNYIIEIKYNSERSSTSNSYASHRNFELNKENKEFKTALKANSKSALAKDYTSHSEPEVRAGPMYFYI